MSCYVYCGKGNKYFTDVTHAEDYYLTRSEKEIISDRTVEILDDLLGGDRSQRFNIVETGCGNGEKAEILI